MRFDAHLLDQLESTPVLHLYHWARPSATYGYFIKPETLLNMEAVQRHGIDLARRPTGGGIVFHIWDLAFSFLMPSNQSAFSLNTLENYQFVNKAVIETVKSYFSLTAELIKEDLPSLGSGCKNFCMAMPTQYDVVYQGVKIAGAAQRRKAQGYLHQGTISLAIPDQELLEELLISKDVLKAMSSFTFTPVKERLEEHRLELQKLLADKLKDALN